MACGFDKGLIAAHYDGETTPEEHLLVERHLATCPECARDLASMKTLSSALKPLARASAPMSIAEGVIREIGSARPVHRPWKAWLTSAAAAVLLAVGTVYMLDRSQGAPSKELLVARPESKAPAASKPAASSRDEEMARTKHLRSGVDPRKAPAADRELAESPKVELSPPPPPPASPVPPPAPAELAEPGRTGGAKDPVLEDSKQENRWQKTAVPVVRVTTPDPVLARAAVDAFLKERERRQVVAGATLLGRTAFVRDRYLQLDLSEEESKELEKRLAALKETLVVPGSFEEEKKRVAEELAKLKKEDNKESKAHLKPDDTKDKDAESEKKEELDGVFDRSRLLGKDKGVERKKVIFVFDLPPPPKK